MNVGLEGKTVLITGGSSGIGKATALAYGRETQAQVVITWYKNEESARQLAQTIEEKGGNALAVPMSLEKHNSIEEAVEIAVKHFGSIDVLVNNAVFFGNVEHRRKSFEEMPISQWKETIGVNLYGTVKITQEVVPHMREAAWGRIVNISSDVAHDSMQGSGPYGSLKAALFGFNANLVAELSQAGILSNVVLPSLTLTEKARNHFPEGYPEAARQAFPTHRVTKPDDVASLILYLGSAANKHVNGEHINVTGKGSQAMLKSLLKEYIED